ncbi:MAG: VanZ family protein [Chitinophagaceae bacterium]|nr:VanZ family protein [Chitinophagaceae bacterium]HMN32407.1 VanZ family protein [Chitinophagaceae bacterium]
MKTIFKYFTTHPQTTKTCAILWTILIIIGCSVPGSDIPKLNLIAHFDKLVHFTFFFAFFILWYLYFHHIKHIIILLILISASFGFLIEWYQLHFVAGRSFDVWDGIADTIGAIFGSLFIVLFMKK